MTENQEIKKKDTHFYQKKKVNIVNKNDAILYYSNETTNTWFIIFEENWNWNSNNQDI